MPMSPTSTISSRAPTWPRKSLEEIIQAADGGVFNNAAQVWNHTFYWNCMKPGGGGAPSGDLAAAIDEAFGSYRRLQDRVLPGGGHPVRLRLGLARR